MTTQTRDLTALIGSRICHDLISLWAQSAMGLNC